LLALSCGAVEGEERTAAYRVRTTSNVQLLLPVVTDLSRVLYRDAAGQWTPLPVEVLEQTLRVKIDVGSIKNGRTMLVLNVPDDVNLNDDEPPEVVRFEVDGRDHGAVTEVALGGVEQPPRQVRVEVRDKLNSLDASSLKVTANGKQRAQGAPGVAFESLGPDRGVVSLDLAKLIETASNDNSISIVIDDRALDEKSLRCSLNFRHIAPRKLPDGSALSVDTVVPKAAWAEWWVVADGVKMDDTYSTTVGYTWLSEAASQAHWIKLEFPAARKISGVRLWWAYYQAFRTSVAYEVQTWDGAQWVTQATVKGQAERQCSEHAFDAVATTAVRVWQPPGSGHPERAEYMWLSEFEAF